MLNLLRKNPRQVLTRGQLLDCLLYTSLFGQAQVEVIVLTTVVGCTLIAAHSGQQLCAEHAQGADIVVGAQIIQHIRCV